MRVCLAPNSVSVTRPLIQANSIHVTETSNGKTIVTVFCPTGVFSYEAPRTLVERRPPRTPRTPPRAS